jgi:hypothetical protein
MAIRNISRLQHRRGLRSDLPPKLHEGEIGWCLDTRELFIGNSDAYGANTQVLTQWTPNDQLIQHAYVGATGIPAASIPRSIGQITDDFLTVKSYGAKGNGVDDDYQAIQKAISDRYVKAVANGYSPLSGFVTIWLPAGTYRITQPLKLYPFVELRGEGDDRTKIVLDNELVGWVIQTADSDGNTEANIGLEGAILPDGINLTDLWIHQPNANGDVIRLQRSSRVRLKGSKFSGPREYPSPSTNDTAGVRIESLGTVPELIPNDIIIHDCEMIGLAHGVYSDDPIADLRIDLASFRTCKNGVTLGASAVLGGPTRTKVTNSIFINIEDHGIACYGSNLGAISTGNSFDDVGVYGQVPAIYWDSDTSGCASIGDQFGEVHSKVDDRNPSKNVIVGPQQVSISTMEPNLIGPITLTDNFPTSPQNTPITYDITRYNTINIDYSLNRSPGKRIGKLTILTDGVDTVLQDEYTTLGADLGVTFGYKLIANVITLTYTTSTTGNAAVMTYTENKWLS